MPATSPPALISAARIGIDGKVFGDFEYNILFDFGGSGSEDAGHIQELWAQYSAIAPFHLRAGAFQPSIGLEDQNSTNGMPFLERQQDADLVRGLSAGDFREGAELWADGKQWFASGAVTSRLVGVELRQFQHYHYKYKYNGLHQIRCALQHHQPHLHSADQHQHACQWE